MIQEHVAGSTERWFAGGETIVGQGELTSCLYVVVQGIVKLTVVSAAGREAAVGLLGPGDVFGEHGMFEPVPCPWRARALRGCRITIIPRDALRSSLDRHPSLALALLRRVEARLRRTSEALENALLHDVPTRVSRQLATLARDHGRAVDGGLLIEAGLTQEDLAQMIGSSRETVNKAIAYFVARGLLRIRGRRYLVPDAQALEHSGVESDGVRPGNASSGMGV